MQMTITVHHDFSSLDAVLDKIVALLSGVALQQQPVSRAQLPVPSTDGAAGVSAPVATPAAPAPTPPADVQPKKRRGRPPKNAAPEAPAPAAPETPAADPFAAAPQPAAEAPTPAAAKPAPITKDEENHLRTRILRMVEIVGDKKYTEIRAELGNPRITELTREQFDTFLTTVNVELAKHGE